MELVSQFLFPYPERCQHCHEFLPERLSLTADREQKALSIATAAMLTRCAFRVAELSQGFKGSIWFNEVAYMVLEGGSISLCVLLLTVGHVGIAFGGHYREADFKLRVRKADKEEEEAAAVQEHS